MNLSFFIAKRYLFSKKKFSFITIISLISVLGVTIGVAAIIIVLSVFNGFQKRVTDNLVNFDPHIRIEAADSNKLADYNTTIEKLTGEGIKAVAPYTLNKGMLTNAKYNKVLFIKGTDQNKISDVSGIKNLKWLGEFNLEDEGDYGGIVIGLTLADQMRVNHIGDTLTLLSPVGLESSVTQFVEPKTKKFIVRGIFDADDKDYNLKYAYISIENSQYLFDLGDKVNGIEMRLADINDSEKEKTRLMSLLGKNFNVMTWYDLHSDFYSILKLERIVAFIILSIIIAVASFNILGSLTMTVIEKKRDIGVLKAMGASDNMIMKIFLYEGISVGLIGMISGSLLGLAVTLGQLYFKFYRLDPSIYKIDAMPVVLTLQDFIYVPLAAFVLCFLASLYPSKRASSLKPVDSIRWE
ncbi:MAG: ABC transporter permease [Bacteroidetes bacterium]|nr:ABC transporter permease [Bacteroidota bacterium]